MEKRGQITIFVILGIIIIVIFILFFLLRTNIKPEINYEISEKNPNYFLKTCIEDDLRYNIDKISINGGYLNPVLTKTFKFENEEIFSEIAYLCYTKNYYVTCVNQEPMFINHLKNELKESISDEVQECFDSLAKSFEKEGYVVDASYRGFDLYLKYGELDIKLNAELKLTNPKESFKENNFKIVFKTKIYDLTEVVQEIVSQEARFCNFDNTGYMMIHPQIKISKFRTSDFNTLYTLEHKKTKEKFRFAIRGCAIPPGI